MTLVAPHIVNDVSYVCDEDQACESSAWQGYYLVRLEGNTCCSAHCK